MIAWKFLQFLKDYLSVKDQSYFMIKNIDEIPVFPIRKSDPDIILYLFQILQGKSRPPYFHIFSQSVLQKFSLLHHGNSNCLSQNLFLPLQEIAEATFQAQ